MRRERILREDAGIAEVVSADSTLHLGRFRGIKEQDKWAYKPEGKTQIGRHGSRRTARRAGEKKRYVYRREHCNVRDKSQIVLLYVGVLCLIVTACGGGSGNTGGGNLVMAVSESTLTFAGVRGSDAKPAPSSVTVSNTGTGALRFTVTSDSPWLTVTPSSGIAPQSLQISATTQLAELRHPFDSARRGLVRGDRRDVNSKRTGPCFA
jgi:Viral BACON domain